nr:type II toxin-antitoxin system RelE/ParE family toxin [Massilia sp. Root351]
MHKFKLHQPEILLAHRLQPDTCSPTTVVLLSIGSHEHFYADLKRLT